MRSLTGSQARRIALAAQGFTDPRPGGRVDVRHLRRVLDRVGTVQIDSVNVAVRTHYMPFFSRLGPYPMDLLDELAYRRREIFEYWGHMASYVPAERHHWFRFRMRGITPGRRERKLMEESPGYLEAVLDEVRRRGPLTVSDLEDPGERTGPWWGYGKGKIALEYHFDVGAVAISDRRNFARVYDIAERVIPEDALARPGLSIDDAYRQLLLSAAQSMGVASDASLADYYRLQPTRAKAIVADLAAAGDLEQVEVEGWPRPGYLWPGATLPRRVQARALVSPFDSLIWHRDRTEELFGFLYRIEIYVPEPKRIHGYYVMPFLLGDELVARVDLKADRKAGLLRVPGAFLEPGRDPTRVSHELVVALREMAGWLGLGDVAVGRRGDLTSPLRALV